MLTQLWSRDNSKGWENSRVGKFDGGRLGRDRQDPSYAFRRRLNGRLDYERLLAIAMDYDRPLLWNSRLFGHSYRRPKFAISHGRSSQRG